VGEIHYLEKNKVLRPSYSKNAAVQHAYRRTPAVTKTNGYWMPGTTPAMTTENDPPPKKKARQKPGLEEGV
jgi:hypothetical protein